MNAKHLRGGSTLQRSGFGRLYRLCEGSEDDFYGELALVRAKLMYHGKCAHQTTAEHFIRSIAMNESVDKSINEENSKKKTVNWPDVEVRMRIKALYGEQLLINAAKARDEVVLRMGISFVEESRKGKDAYAFFLFGIMHEHGNPCVEKNAELSKKMFEESARLGLNNAELMLIPLNWEKCTPQNRIHWSSLIMRIYSNAIRGECELNGFGIGDAGMESLDDPLKKNISIDRLILQHNEIGDFGAENLADALSDNESLTHLDLWSNRIGWKGAKAIAKMLEVNTTLTTLYLQNNDVGDEGAMILADSLAINHSLTALYLRNNNIGAQAKERLREVVSRRTDFRLVV